MNKKNEHGKKPGPEPDRLKIDGDWEDAVKKALSKPRPAEGWPKPDDPADTESAEEESK